MSPWVYADDRTGSRADTRIVVDISGSMRRTDPENLRIPATRLLTRLAQNGSRAGVWTFGQYVNMLVPWGEVNDAWRQNALEQTGLINSVALWTNIGLALEKASLGQSTPDPERDRTIILLSDGKVDIDRDPAVNEQENERIFRDLVPRLVAAGFRIHAVALSDEADHAFLKKLATDTRGAFSIARTADDLIKVFAAASDQINQPEQVPLDNNSFRIDNSIQEFTALIHRRPGSEATRLITPGRIALSSTQHPDTVNWHADQRYDLITVTRPEPGLWKIQAALDPANRVTIVTDLSIELRGLPENVIEGERIQMRLNLRGSGKVVTEANFLKLMEITFSQETPSGERFEGKLADPDRPNVPADGVYTALLGRTLTEGEQVFHVMLDGKTFQRKRTQRMMVHRDVLQVDVLTDREAPTELKYLQVNPKAALVNMERLEVMAQILMPNGERMVQTAQRLDSGNWRVDVPNTASAGVYRVMLKAIGQSRNDRPFELVQGPYEVDYTPVGLASDPLPLPADIQSVFDETDQAIDAATPDPVVSPESTPTEQSVASAASVADTGDSTSDEKGQTVADAAGTAETGWPMWVWALIGGGANLVLIGGGVYLYRRLTRKEEQDYAAVEEEISRLHAHRKGGASRAVEPQISDDSVPLLNESAAVASFATLDEDEETVVKTAAAAEPQAGAQVTATVPRPQPPAEPAPVQSAPPAAAPPVVAPPVAAATDDRAYKSTAKPIELDDDEMIELDDDTDAGGSIASADEDNMDDLDLMLSQLEDDEQELEQGAELDEAENPEAIPQEPESAPPLLSEIAEEAQREADEPTEIQPPESRPAVASADPADADFESIDDSLFSLDAQQDELDDLFAEDPDDILAEIMAEESTSEEKDGKDKEQKEGTEAGKPRHFDDDEFRLDDTDGVK
jgi:uncharacterized protein (TIGR03503 family)